MTMGSLARRYLARRSSVRDAARMDVDRNGTISKQELRSYIDRNAKLWAMLAVNLNLPESTCRDIATQVAFRLAKSLKTIKKNERRSLPRKKRNRRHRNQSSEHDQRERAGNDEGSDDDVRYAEDDREPTVEELSNLIDFLHTAVGQQEFFHRTVFCAFDADQNGYLDVDELDEFCEIFYAADSIFAGDARLPPHKGVLKQNVMEKFDTNGDGQLSFEEMRVLLTGGASGLQAQSLSATTSSSLSSTSS